MKYRQSKERKRLPFVQQVVFQSLFHLEDEVPKAVHRYGSDEHSSIVPYLKNNENKHHINNNGHKNTAKQISSIGRGQKTNGNETATTGNHKSTMLATLSTEKYVQSAK